MPRPGLQWRHVIVSTYASWLPGDPRGFRSQDHKIHSSGDYQAPPPEGEHEGLHEYSKKMSGGAVLIPANLREVVGRAFLAKLQQKEMRVLALSVAGMHVHILAELPELFQRMHTIVGECKVAACLAVRKQMPGRLWARHGKFKLVDNPEYQKRVYKYILRQEGAWLWSFVDEDDIPATPPPNGSGIENVDELNAPETSPLPDGDASETMNDS
jgi:REP element-mobilizing transposase RayT